MFTPSHKKVLLGVLVACFLVQTGLVYADRREAPLTEAAVRGRVIYHDQACQVCHQLYGQGGFLGPDLTNAARRVDDARLHSLLTVGSGQMPALHLSDAEISDLRAFLNEIDRPDLGWGQLRLGERGDEESPQAVFEASVNAHLTLGSREAEGFAAMAARPCTQCHFPFQVSIVGAPDLSTVAGRLSLEEMRTVLESGRPEKGMPPPGPPFAEGEVDAVIAYLEWLAANRDAVAEEMEGRAVRRRIEWSALPWWEFK